MLPVIGWRSLRTKIIVWSFVPTAIILFAVALVVFTAYQQVIGELVVERDQELTRISAGQLATELTEHTDTLSALARASHSYMGDPAVLRLPGVLRWASNRLAVFDGGVVTLDTFGRVVAAEPPRPEALGQDWSSRKYFRQLVGSPKPVFSGIVADGPQGAEVVVVAVPITGNRGEFLGATVGMFRVGAAAASPFYGGMAELRIGDSASTWLVDGDGRVIYHPDPDCIGEDFSTQAVVQQVLSGRVGAIRVRDSGGQDNVTGFAPVPGTAWGLITEENWATLTSSYRSYQQFLILLLVLGVVVPAVVVAVGVRRIIRPITELISAAQAVARGNFGQSITARTGDEIEELARQFNLMSVQLQESYTNLEQRVADRTQELATLNAIAAVVSRSLDLQEILNDALDKTLEVMDIEAGGIYLLQEDGRVLTMAAHRGFMTGIERLSVDDGFLGCVVQSGEPLVVDDISTDPRLPPLAAKEEGLQSVAGFPLVSRRKVLGALFMVTRGYREFSHQDIGLLTAIGHQIGVAVENARLYEQARQLAVLEERQRLARDLHDSVTQSLYGVTMYAEAAARLLPSGEVELAADHLRELRDTAQEALQEMRLLIFELRPPLLQEEGLVAALQARLEAVEARAGLETEFDVEGTDRLPLETAQGLYGIAREVLNNVLKHAQARHLSVHLVLDGPLVTLEITDDGIGCDPLTAREQGGLGWRGMEERANQLGGKLTVRSRPGEGTSVRVEVTR